MKKTILGFGATTIAIAAIILFACNNEKIDSNDTEFQLRSGSAQIDYGWVGEMHNEFMTNIKNNFVPDENITKLEDKIDFIRDFNIDFASITNRSVNEKKIMSNYFEEYKRFVHSENFYDEFFVSTLGSGDSEYFKLIQNTYSLGIIDEFEFNQFILIGRKAIENNDGLISNEDFVDVIYHINDLWNAKNYSENSKNGHLLGMTLSIALASIDWWSENPCDFDNGRAWQVVVAADVIGGVVGGAVGGVVSYGTGGSINWWSVGAGAGMGALNASTGWIGKVAKWVVAVIS